jgi:three-Cys-motif partner protein
LIDPHGADFWWDSLSGLVLHERMDAMILFPEDMDLERNLLLEERNDPYFPSPEWRRCLAARNRGAALREVYKSGLRHEHGYEFGADKTVRNRHGAPIYKLLYASRNKLGLHLWEDCTRRTPYGQETPST